MKIYRKECSSLIFRTKYDEHEEVLIQYKTWGKMKD